MEMFFVKSNNPTNPKIKNKIPENFCITFSENFLLKTFPNIIAIKSLNTIATTAPNIKSIL